MSSKLRQRILPFRIEMTNEPLIARAGLVLPYEMAFSKRMAGISLVFEWTWWLL